ncbi:hypothetical protein [Parapedobacter defluvii]|nr:hypothetical protein [Parapedobacter defluvii]
MKISELDVIEFLTERREKLAAELRSIDTTIAGLKSETDMTVGPGFDADKSKRLQSRTDSGKAEREMNRQLKINVPSEYNVSDSVDKRILFVIKTLGKGNRDEILDEIKTKYEPNGNFERLEANVKVRLSFLLKQGAIKGEKKGRFYQYSLN